MKKIKTSNIIIIGLVLAIFISISVIIIQNGFAYQKSIEVNIEKMIPIEMEEFSNISASGNIYIEVSKADKQEILISPKIKSDSALHVKVEQNTLFVNFSDKTNELNTKSQIVIKIPAIKSLTANNSAGIKVGKYEFDSLQITQYGGSVNLDSMTAKALNLKMYNGSKLWCKGLKVNHLDIDLSNNVFCSFDPITADTITGEIKDHSQLNAHGTINLMQIRADSTGRINKYY